MMCVTILSVMPGHTSSANRMLRSSSSIANLCSECSLCCCFSYNRRRQCNVFCQICFCREFLSSGIWGFEWWVYILWLPVVPYKLYLKDRVWIYWPLWRQERWLWSDWQIYSADPDPVEIKRRRMRRRREKRKSSVEVWAFFPHMNSCLYSICLFTCSVWTQRHWPFHWGPFCPPFSSDGLW